ncbi:MAG: T9SS type A sorting domain-containing protein [Bacteroidales bacterium]|nr:T9SS type A sorting domain-containing protein [Bacteroidales bacterium]
MNRDYHKTMMLSVIALLITGLSIAQTSVNTSGGTGSGYEGTTTYSIGQIIVTAESGQNGSVTHGIQQSFEMYLLNNSETASPKLSMKVFPNPATDYVVLEIKEPTMETYSYRLFNTQGNILESDKIADQQTEIDIKHLPSQVYFLQVYEHIKPIQSIIIIKY